LQPSSGQLKRLLSARDTQFGDSALYTLIRGAVAGDTSHYFNTTEPFASAQREYYACLRLLLDADAAKHSAGPDDGGTPLHLCAKLVTAKSVLQLGRLLLERGADPNSKDREGRAPLLYAARGGQGEDFILMLFEFGAEPDVSGQCCQTPGKCFSVR
jgi:Ankyrin repeats (3 copies)